MDATKLMIIRNTLQKIRVAGEDDIRFMLGAMQMLTDLINTAQKEAEEAAENAD